MLVISILGETAAARRQKNRRRQAAVFLAAKKNVPVIRFFGGNGRMQVAGDTTFGGKKGLSPKLNHRLLVLLRYLKK